MKIELTSPNSFTREMKVELSWEEIADDYAKIEKQVVKNIKLPGFRPGKVPKKIILQQYQPAIDAQFVDEAIQKYYMQALTQEKVTPINQAQVDDIDFKNGDPLSFKTTFEVEPEVVLPELKKNSLKVQKTVYESDQEDVDNAVLDVRERFSEVKTVEEGAREGDFVIGDLQKVDEAGVAVIGEKFEKRYIKVGDGVFGGDNTARLLGLKTGDTARLDIPDGEGKEVNHYELTVTNVEERVLAEINEDFLKQVDPKAKDEADWRNRIKEQIDHNLEHRSDDAFSQALADAIIEVVKPEYPPSMVESYLDRVVEDAKKENQGAEEDKIREVYRPMAEQNLKWYLIHNALVKQQGFEAKDDEINAEIEKLVERTPEGEKEIRKFYKKPSNRKKLGDDLVEKQIQAYLVEHAKVKEVKVTTKEMREQTAKE